MLAFKLSIIKRSLSRTVDAGGLLVGIVKELISHVIIAPVVVKFERCDAMGVVHSNLLGELE
eukprot:9960540-Ditylum_brightwellii.AAC.1